MYLICQYKCQGQKVLGTRFLIFHQPGQLDCNIRKPVHGTSSAARVSYSTLSLDTLYMHHVTCIVLLLCRKIPHDPISNLESWRGWSRIDDGPFFGPNSILQCKQGPLFLPWHGMTWPTCVSPPTQMFLSDCALTLLRHPLTGGPYGHEATAIYIYDTKFISESCTLSLNFQWTLEHQFYMQSQSWGRSPKNWSRSKIKIKYLI